jgi:hypothetical protein
VNVSLGVTSGDQSRHSLQTQGEVQTQHRRQIYNSSKVVTTFASGDVHCGALKRLMLVLAGTQTYKMKITCLLGYCTV